jgi:ribose transport system permease protein
MEKKKLHSIKNILTPFVPYLGLLLVILVFYITTKGRLFSPYNTRIVIQQTTALAIICLGAVFVYSLGELDVSIGATVGICTLIIINIINSGYPLIAGFAAALALALCFGFINGAVSTWLGLPSIVTSLFLMFVGGGMQALITLKTNTITTNYDFSLWKETWFQISVLVIVSIIIAYLYNFTRIGKYEKSIGANRISSAQSGVNVFKYRIIAFLIMGCNIAVASIFILARSASSSKATGSGMHMDVMIALILGGMPLKGGMKGRFSTALVGSFIYVLLTNGLTLSGVGITYVPLVKSIIFMAIVIITCRQKDGVLPR